MRERTELNIPWKRQNARAAAINVNQVLQLTVVQEVRDCIVFSALPLKLLLRAKEGIQYAIHWPATQPAAYRNARTRKMAVHNISWWWAICPVLRTTWNTYWYHAQVHSRLWQACNTLPRIWDTELMALLQYHFTLISWCWLVNKGWIDAVSSIFSSITPPYTFNHLEYTVFSISTINSR